MNEKYIHGWCGWRSIWRQRNYFPCRNRLMHQFLWKRFITICISCALPVWFETFPLQGNRVDMTVSYGTIMWCGRNAANWSTFVFRIWLRYCDSKCMMISFLWFEDWYFVWSLSSCAGAPNTCRPKTDSTAVWNGWSRGFFPLNHLIKKDPMTSK